MKTTIELLTEKVQEFCITNYIKKGFIACSSEGFCLKCIDHEAAASSGLRYVFFVDRMGNEITLYNS